jgi:multidrug efflux pump subunit AcrA (membrane-fusion protein)
MAIPRVVLLAWLLLGTVAAGDAYDPHSHPGVAERRITGYTRPLAQLDLAPELPGRLLAVEPQPGQRLAEGAVPVRLDPVLADLAVRQAQESLAGSEATLAVRQAEVERLKSELELSRREGARIEELAGTGSASQRDLDQARTARARASLVVAAAEAALVANRAECAAAAVRLDEARERRARHDLAAPAGWVVQERLLEPGAIVQAGQAVLRLADTSALVVQIRLDEDEVAVLRARASAGTLRVRFCAADREAPARLRRIDVAFDPASRKRLAELLVAGGDAPEASGGLAVEVGLEVPDPGMVQVPATHLAWRLEQPWVRTDAGVDLPLRPRRRLSGGAVAVEAGQIPAGTLLVPPATAATGR